MSNSRFSGYHVVVTGAAGEIGSAIVRSFVQEGARVAVADINLPAAMELSADLSSSTCALKLDVTDEESWSSLFRTLDERVGKVDVLINNAGFFHPNIAFEEMSLDLWQRHFKINSDSVFLGCKFGIRHMKKHGGTIINIGSGMGVRAQPLASAYCASKAAMLMTTQAAAMSAGAYQIRINAVLPGAIESPMLFSGLKSNESRQSFLSRITAHSMLGRLATPKDIAQCVLFLADPMNSAITGAIIPVDGGNI